MIKAAAGGGGRGIRKRQRRRRARARARPRSRREAARRVRRRHGLHGGDGRQRAPHRGAADRRRPGPGVGGRRARLLVPAPPPEGHRGVLQRRAHARAGGRGQGGRRGASRSQSGYRNAGTVEFLYEPDREALLLHGGQRAPAGRAPRHRGGHRPRPRQAAAARRRRRQARGRAARARRPRDRGAPERRGSRRWASRPRPAASRCSTSPPAPACASTAASPPATSSRPTSTRWSRRSSPTAAPATRRSRACAARCARRTVIIEDGTTNRAFLLAILDRPEFKAGEVDIAWLDRLGVVRRDGGRRTAPTPRCCRPRSSSPTTRPRPSARASTPSPAAAAPRPARRSRAPSRSATAARPTGSSSPSSRPGRYRADVDGTAVEAEVERLSGHERRITIGGVTHRAMISRQGADLLVEVHGVPHRITRDDGGFVRSHGPSVVVAIPVSEGDEVAEGDVVAVVESMKMETSLTAPFAGRVRRVLTGTNVQVPAHTPLLQLEAIEDEAAEQSAERVELRGRRAASSDAPCAAALDRLRWMLLGYDVSGDEVRRALADAARRRRRRRADRGRAPPARRLHRRARARAAPATTRSASCCTARRSTCTRSCARSTPRPSGCPSASSRLLAARARALRRREPRPHARAGGGLLPAVRLPGARRPRPRRRDGDPRAAPASAPTSSSATSATSSAACSTGSSWPPSAATR